MMLTEIPFLYVNMLSLCAYVLMFTVFAAAKKTPEIRAFLILLIDSILWTGGSTLMRLQVWPGLDFWYYVSLLAIFSMELCFYLFLHCFAGERGHFRVLLLAAATIALYPMTVSGFFLPPPVPIQQENGIVYAYRNVSWHILFPLLVFVLIIVFSVQLLNKMQRQQGAHASGVRLLFWGGVVLLAGNVLQIAISGNTFPFDTLAGVGFACLVVFALYRRRLFRMTLAISRGLLMVTLSVVCLLMDVYLIVPLYRFFTSHIGTDEAGTIMVLSLVLTALLAVSYALLRRLIDALFSREERQNKLVKRFSSDVVQTLSTDDIMKKTTAALTGELPASQVYFCLLDGRRFICRYSSDPLAETDISIDINSPKVRYLQEQNTHLLLSEYRSTPGALSEWAEEKELFCRLNIDCVAAMRDGSQVVGLILLSARDHIRCFSNGELSFLETICSISSIALKNAELYETIFREARIDALTGACNYRAFVDALQKEFLAHGQDCLTMMYIDADDFKLYNQLYGVQEGDVALCRICEEITLATGANGTVYRSSGKVFSAILPGMDSQQANALAHDIQARISRINDTPERRRFKPLAVSIGICSAPYSASSARELMDNTDLACYNAKQNGKNQVVVFRGAQDMAAQRLGERTEAIVDRVENSAENGTTSLSMISALTAAIDAKDHYTYAHSKNVARYASVLAVAAGLNDEQVRAIYAAGLLHDIGKISVPEMILNKTGRLTVDEYATMKDHVNNSIEMIRHLPGMDYLIPAVMGHHERWDGKGYPRGIAGEEIPITARCLSIADVFDAMTSDRPYRKGMPLDYAVSEIRSGAGIQFDPQLAPLFVKLVEDRSLPLSIQILDRLREASVPVAADRQV